MKKILVIILAGTNILAAPIDRAWLVNKEFTASGGIYGMVAQFKTDGTYSIEYSSEGWDWSDSGTYSISGDKIHLQPMRVNGKPYNKLTDAELSMGEAQAFILSKPDDLFYGRYLVIQSKHNKRHLIGDGFDSDSLHFPIPESLLKNVERRFKEIPVIVLGRAKGTTVKNVKIRKGPSVQAEELQYYAEMGADPLAFVPAGTPVTVIARTVNKEQVQGWNKYWYLVDVGFEERVWMYGEFIRVEQ